MDKGINNDGTRGAARSRGRPRGSTNFSRGSRGGRGRGRGAGNKTWELEDDPGFKDTKDHNTRASKNAKERWKDVFENLREVTCQSNVINNNQYNKESNAYVLRHKGKTNLLEDGNYERADANQEHVLRENSIQLNPQNNLNNLDFLIDNKIKNIKNTCNKETDFDLEYNSSRNYLTTEMNNLEELELCYKEVHTHKIQRITKLQEYMQLLQQKESQKQNRLKKQDMIRSGTKLNNGRDDDPITIKDSMIKDIDYDKNDNFDSKYDDNSGNNDKTLRRTSERIKKVSNKSELAKSPKSDGGLKVPVGDAVRTPSPFCYNKVYDNTDMHNPSKAKNSYYDNEESFDYVSMKKNLFERRKYYHQNYDDDIDTSDLYLGSEWPSNQNILLMRELEKVIKSKIKNEYQARYRNRSKLNSMLINNYLQYNTFDK
jgi:hypothetical protein